MSRVEPRLLNKVQAASYCGMHSTTFAANCTVRPVRVYPGERGLRWDRFDLDRWIDSLRSGERHMTASDWLERLGNAEGAREGH